MLLLLIGAMQEFGQVLARNGAIGPKPLFANTHVIHLTLTVAIILVNVLLKTNLRTLCPAIQTYQDDNGEKCKKAAG